MISARVNEDRHRKNMAAGLIPPQAAGEERDCDKGRWGIELTRSAIENYRCRTYTPIAAGPIPPIPPLAAARKRDSDSGRWGCWSPLASDPASGPAQIRL